MGRLHRLDFRVITRNWVWGAYTFEGIIMNNQLLYKFALGVSVLCLRMYRKLCGVPVRIRT
jgi:hypothetical protein